MSSSSHRRHRESGSGHRHSASRTDDGDDRRSQQRLAEDRIDDRRRRDERRDDRDSRGAEGRTDDRRAPRGPSIYAHGRSSYPTPGSGNAHSKETATTPRPLTIAIKGRSKTSPMAEASTSTEGTRPLPRASSSAQKPPHSSSSSSVPTQSSVHTLPPRPTGSHASSRQTSYRGRPPGPAPPQQPQRPLKRPLANYVPEEETIRNDYALRYAVTGEWSGNWIKGANASGHDPGEVCAEYPRLRRLLDLKQDLANNYSHPPLFLDFAPFGRTYPFPDSPMVPQPQFMRESLPPASELGLESATEQAQDKPARSLSPLATPFTGPQFSSPLPLTPSPYMQLTTLLSPHRFSSILITPPPHATWSQIQSLPIRLISAEQSFVFLWVGRGDQDGLERGRELLVKWGFRRCEDIVWVQTNRKRMRGGAASGDDVGTGLMIPMKEHCLMGIRGTVRRSTDPWLIHANVDTDVLVWDGPDENDPEAPTHPPQLYDVIENFCLGTRRLELFVPRSRVRRGWVGIGCTELGVDATKPASVKLQPPQTLPSLATPESSLAVVADLEAQAEGMELADTLAMEGHQVEDFDSERYGVYISRLRDGMGRYVLPHRDDIDALRPKTPPRQGERATPAPNVGYASESGILPRSPTNVMTPYDAQGQQNTMMMNANANNGFSMPQMNMQAMNNPMLMNNPFMLNMNMMTLQQQINNNMAMAQLQMMNNAGAMQGMQGMPMMNDMMTMMSGGMPVGMGYGMMGAMNPAMMAGSMAQMDQMQGFHGGFDGGYGWQQDGQGGQRYVGNPGMQQPQPRR